MRQNVNATVRKTLQRYAQSNQHLLTACRRSQKLETERQPLADIAHWTYATVQAVPIGGIASAPPYSGAVSNAIGTLTLAPQTPTWQAFAPLDFHFDFGVRDAQAVATLAAVGTVVITGFSAAAGKQVASYKLRHQATVVPSDAGMHHESELAEGVQPAAWKSCGHSDRSAGNNAIDG
ncbi:MAG: hypothetical protein Q9202_004112 [Teloschistes flavicans]